MLETVVSTPFFVLLSDTGGGTLVFLHEFLCCSGARGVLTVSIQTCAVFYLMVILT